MKTRRTFLAPLALLAACSGQRIRRIGVVPKATAHLFFVTVHQGVDQAAKDLKLSVEWNGPNDETDHARQIQIVDAMVARQVDGIAISATDERALVAPLERATRAGIPISVFDSAVAIENYVSFVATDNHGAGATAAREMAGLLGKGGKVGMVMQKPGGASTGLREQGFEEVLQKQFNSITIAARQFSMGDRAKARAVAENMLTAHPDMAGLFASSEASSIGAIQAIRARGLAGKVKLITFDDSPVHQEALKEGLIDLMLVQDPFRLGYEAVKALATHLAGQTPQKRLDLPVRLIRKA